jgi:hypothetical protein
VRRQCEKDGVRRQCEVESIRVGNLDRGKGTYERADDVACS